MTDLFGFRRRRAAFEGEILRAVRLLDDGADTFALMRRMEAIRGRESVPIGALNAAVRRMAQTGRLRIEENRSYPEFPRVFLTAAEREGGRIDG